MFRARDACATAAHGAFYFENVIWTQLVYSRKSACRKLAAGSFV